MKTGIPELLAPAGNIESFWAAMESGADAIYLGLRTLSARAGATNFSADELALLLPFARKRNVRIYAAVNSLVSAGKTGEAFSILQSLSAMGIDGVIVQDPAILYMSRTYFPELRIHASTLAAVHNSAGVVQMERMGVHRVVLARELSLDEIEQVSASTQAELELFVHGALCYSYSGLCLASSFRGGRSGLQGRCVQPCRLKFRQGRNEGFYLSCSDFCALPLLPQLKKMRIAALKIEGRMKPADYIATIVRAYRQVLDASPESESDTLAEALEALREAPSRRLTSGLLAGALSEVLSPHRSGSSGLWVGTVKSRAGAHAVVKLRRQLRKGDRIRLESGEGREKPAFTVSEILRSDGTGLDKADPGGQVHLTVPNEVRPNDRLFRVGRKSESPVAIWQKIKRETRTPGSAWKAGSVPDLLRDVRDRFASRLQADVEEQLYIKAATTEDLAIASRSGAHRVMLTGSRSNLERAARQRFTKEQKARFIWSLPALLTQKDLDYYGRAIAWFLEKGFRRWEVNNWGHLALFPKQGAFPPELIAGHRFNIRNELALAAMSEVSCTASVLSLETTGTELQLIGKAASPFSPIVCVYMWPPLFTSRLLPGLLEQKPFTTPRGDTYFLRRAAGVSEIYPEAPVIWFDKMPQLRSWGFKSFMIDVSSFPQDRSHDLERLLKDFRASKTDLPHSSFNFDLNPAQD